MGVKEIAIIVFALAAGYYLGSSGLLSNVLPSFGN